MGVESFPGFLQNETYSAEITRRSVMCDWQRGSTVGSVVGGLIGPADFLITYSGSGLGVNVATGEAIVPGSSTTTQSGYYMRGSSTTALTPAAANPTNPRVDLVCLTVQDKAYVGSTDTPLCQIVTGTPTSGATLANLNGAPSLPTSSLALGYVLIPANAVSITSANISNIAVGVTAQTAGPTIVAKTASFTATPGFFYQCSASITVTLPSPATARQTVGVQANVSNDSAANAITVTTPSGVINGPGAGGASITLAAANAYVVLESDGTNWNIIAGQQDTGWTAASGFSNSWTSNGGPATGATAAGFRLIGNTVRLGGSYKSGTAGTIFTLPAGYRPSYGLTFAVASGGGTAGTQITVATGGAVASNSAFGTVGNMYTDGITFTLA